VNGVGRDDPRLRDVLLLIVAVAGLTMCITLLYEGMRAVMDVGGACADGGPYVSAQPCPDGTPVAMMLGAFGLFGFGALGMVYGAKIGGYGWVPLLAWTGLFAALGWNFLQYGLLNAPDGQVEWGWLIPGVMFQLMAWVPVVLVILGLWGARNASSGASRAARIVPNRILPNTMRGSGFPKATAIDVVETTPGPAAPRTVREQQLQAIDTLMGAALTDARTSVAGSAAPGGTASMLEHLEHLGEMRDRGLLTTAEYETAKEAVMRELEGRS
jgi:hypothetical protein